MLKLLIAPNTVLQSKAEDWDFNVDSDPIELEQQMIKLMSTANGIGLAANQVGILKRVFTIQLQNGQSFAMFNPKVVSASQGMQSGTEGCLSFPDLWLDIDRPKRITSEYLDSSGKECIIELSDIDARCFLHELDHLDGVCFTDKISSLKLALAKKKQFKRKYNGRTK